MLTWIIPADFTHKKSGLFAIFPVPYNQGVRINEIYFRAAHNPMIQWTLSNT